MEFELSKPQQLLQKSARDLFGRECPPKRVRELMATDTALNPELWSAVADQGWLGIHLTEEVGGLGLGTVDLAVISEEMGRACFPGPFLGTVWAATLFAATNPKAADAEKLTTGELKGAVALLEPDGGWNLADIQLAATPHDGGFTLSGKKSFVLDANVADLFVVVARSPKGLVLATVPAKAKGIKLEPTAALDATRKLADVSFDKDYTYKDKSTGRLVIMQALSKGTLGPSAPGKADSVGTLVALDCKRKDLIAVGSYRPNQPVEMRDSWRSDKPSKADGPDNAALIAAVCPGADSLPTK